MIYLTIASNLMGLLATLVIIVLFLAGAANASAAAIRQMKWLIRSVLLVQLLSLTLSVTLINGQHHWLAFALGLLPVLFAIGLVVVLVKLQG